MAERVLELTQVAKKFRRGELHDSLRDAIPALLRRLTRGGNRADLNEREFWALRDVSFAVSSGEVLGIIGHNGAGKSTVLKILSGVLQPTRGTVRVRGSLSALIEVGAGFHPDLSGRQNIYLNGAILGMKRGEIARKFDRIVAFSGLEEFLDMPVKRYSTGMYARLGFAVAAHVDPEILVVDEVLSVGDYVFQNKCMERMREIVKGGAAVIFVSHNLNAVASLCTRALLLDHGCVTSAGSPREVIETYLGKARRRHDDCADKEAYIVRTAMRDRHGPRTDFKTGEDAWIDVDVRANHRCEQLSLTLYLRDDSDYGIFDTSTERLGLPAFSLEVGESIRFVFRLKLHLARGTFHVGAHLYRYNIQKMYDDCYPLATVFITSERDVRGAANLYPEVVTATPPSTLACRPACQTACPPMDDGTGAVVRVSARN
jgi:ABC-type polysaccharide/polyol phosphate transport system ATPase subunit